MQRKNTSSLFRDLLRRLLLFRLLLLLGVQPGVDRRRIAAQGEHARGLVGRGQVLAGLDGVAGVFLFWGGGGEGSEARVFLFFLLFFRFVFLFFFSPSVFKQALAALQLCRLEVLLRFASHRDAGFLFFLISFFSRSRSRLSFRLFVDCRLRITLLPLFLLSLYRALSLTLLLLLARGAAAARRE